MFPISSRNLMLTFRDATAEDLTIIIALLSTIRRMSNGLTAREDVPEEVPSPEYAQAFKAIQHDENTDIIVGVLDGVVVAMAQISYVQGLALRATKRAIVEDVRVAPNLRGRGIGRALMQYMTSRARNRGCSLLQLTTNDGREDAIAFYKKLGFHQTHVGLRMKL
jgi:ribosomal protein S18 acetylase RimI-like enzyme